VLYLSRQCRDRLACSHQVFNNLLPLPPTAAADVDDVLSSFCVSSIVDIHVLMLCRVVLVQAVCCSGSGCRAVAGAVAGDNRWWAGRSWCW
jgi:hypothetical protein